MKRKLSAIAVITISTLITIAAPSRADIASEEIVSSCTIKLGVKAQFSKIFPTVKVYPKTSKKPYSEPVISFDDFNGQESIIVTDRHFERGFYNSRVIEAGVISTWTPVMIAATAYAEGGSYLTKKPTEMTLKVGSEVFSMESIGNGSFMFSPELADALQRSTDVKVRLRMATGNEFDYPIGAKTIESWRSIRNGLKAHCT